MRVTSETFANMSIALMCLVVSYAAFDRYVMPSTSGAPAAAAGSFNAGDRATTDLEQLRLGDAQLTALVVLSNTCIYCIESAGFYRRLAELETRAGGRFQTLFLGVGGASDAEQFASTHHLERAKARATPPDLQARVPGTPTLILIDARGRVTHSWVGKLSKPQEEEVVASVSQGIGEV
jgi:hypothetical protein